MWGETRHGASWPSGLPRHAKSGPALPQRSVILAKCSPGFCFLPEKQGAGVSGTPAVFNSNMIFKIILNCYQTKTKYQNMVSRRKGPFFALRCVPRAWERMWCAPQRREQSVEQSVIHGRRDELAGLRTAPPCAVSG